MALDFQRHPHDTGKWADIFDLMSRPRIRVQIVGFGEKRNK
jgi:hypothetical protein